MNSLRDQASGPKSCAEATWLGLSQIKYIKIDDYLTGQKSGLHFSPGTLRNQDLVGLSNLSKLYGSDSFEPYAGSIPSPCSMVGLTGG